MKRALLMLLASLAGCAVNQSPVSRLSHCDRLEIWKAVVVSTAFANQVNEVVKYETGRDEWADIYSKQLAPTLKRFGLSEIEALQAFEDEGGFPYRIVPLPGVNAPPQ